MGDRKEKIQKYIQTLDPLNHWNNSIAEKLLTDFQIDEVPVIKQRFDNFEIQFTVEKLLLDDVVNKNKELEKRIEYLEEKIKGIISKEESRQIDRKYEIMLEVLDLPLSWKSIFPLLTLIENDKVNQSKKIELLCYMLEKYVDYYKNCDNFGKFLIAKCPANFRDYASDYLVRNDFDGHFEMHMFKHIINKKNQ